MNKEFKKVFKISRDTNKEYQRVINVLHKLGIDYVLSKKKSNISKTRSIYIIVTKYESHPLEMRISDHSKTHEFGIPEDQHLFVDFTKKINIRQFKKDLLAKGIFIHDKRRQLVERNKNDETKKFKKKIKKLVKQIIDKKGSNELRRIQSTQSYGYGTIEERLKILEQSL